MKSWKLLSIIAVAAVAAVAAVSYHQSKGWDQNKPASSPVRNTIPEVSKGEAATLSSVLQKLSSGGRNRVAQGEIDLSEDEVEIVGVWLKHFDAGTEMDNRDLEQARHVVEEIGTQTSALAVWSGILADLQNDGNVDNRLRGLAIVEMSQFLEPKQDGRSVLKDYMARQDLIKSLVATAANSKDDLAGSALKALASVLAQRTAGERTGSLYAKVPLSFSDDQLRPLAINLAICADTREENRTAAFEVCVSRGFRGILGPLRRTSMDKEWDINVRSEAIKTLGALGSVQDEAVLEVTEKDQDIRIREVSKAALKSLSEHINGGKIAKI